LLEAAHGGRYLEDRGRKAGIIIKAPLKARERRMNKFSFLPVLACAAALALFTPHAYAESGGAASAVKKFFHIGGNEGASPVYVNPVVPQGSVLPNKIDPSLMKPYLFGAYKPGSSGNRKMDSFMSSLAMLDKINRLASDQAQAQRNSHVHSVMTQDKAQVEARNARAMQVMAQQAATFAGQVNSGASSDPLRYTEPAPAQGSSSRRSGRLPSGSYQKNAPIIMPH
jgi:hypothetical protein